MFARLKICREARQLVRYNERKITKGEARLIHAENFVQKTEDLTQRAIIGRFRSMNELNQRSKENMVSVVLSFNEQEMTDGKMKAVANRYMEGMGLQDQPYLVYRHEDTGHPHMHVVSNMIDPNGQAIRVYKAVMDKRRQAREEIMREFGLRGPEKTEKIQIKEGERPRKLIYGKANTTEGMEKILETVVPQYHYTGMEEYNAILRGYNMWVREVKAAKKFNRKGLVYQALDGDGKGTGKPLTASSFENKPTWKHLQTRFVENAVQDEDRTKDLVNRLKWVLHQKPADLSDFSAKLAKEKISMVVVPGVGGDAKGELVYVDHHSKLAVGAKRLPERVREPWIGEKIGLLMQTHKKKAVAPQQVNDLLAQDRALEGPEEKQTQQIKPKHKLRLHV